MKKKLLIIMLAMVTAFVFVLSGCKSSSTKGLIFTVYPDDLNYFSVSGGDKKDYTTVNLPKPSNSVQIKSIDINAFENCTALVSINIPDSVTTIGSGAFRNCKALTSILIPESVLTIGAETFKASGLASITLPNISELGTQSFAFCTALAKADIGGAVKIIQERAFLGCFNLQSVLLPAGIKEIRRGAFESCPSLKNINFPAGLEIIEGRSFAGCAALENISFQDGLTTVGGNAFKDCTGLKSVSLPQTLQELEDNAFENCSSLQSVTVYGLRVINPAAFDLQSPNFELKVPQSMLEQYKSAEGWSDIADRIFAIE